MAAATIIGILVIPGLYVLFGWFSNRRQGNRPEPVEPGSTPVEELISRI